MNLAPYGKNQDGESSVGISADGAEGRIVGNAWKTYPVTYKITKNTVFEFDFKSENLGEIHAVGFDKDAKESSNRIFQVAGTQRYGIQDFHPTYTGAAPGDWRHYRIPVGDFYRGVVKFLVLINDHDVNPPTAHSSFANIRLYEAPKFVASTLFPAADIGAYGAGGGIGELSEDRSVLGLLGPGALKVRLPQTNLTGSSVLRFDFMSTVGGDAHAITVDRDATVDSNRTVRLFGSGDFGVPVAAPYEGSEGEWKTFDIPLSPLRRGKVRYVALINKGLDLGMVSMIRNVRIFRDRSLVLPQAEADRCSLKIDRCSVAGTCRFMSRRSKAAASQSGIIRIERSDNEGVDWGILEDVPADIRTAVRHSVTIPYRSRQLYRIVTGGCVSDPTAPKIKGND